MGIRNKDAAKMRETEQGKRLYYYWKCIRKRSHDPVFDDFVTFHNWAVKNGYFIGARLHLIDPEKPYSSDNCEWNSKIKRDKDLNMDVTEPAVQIRIIEWNRVVNRLRIHYGMEPFPEEIEDE